MVVYSPLARELCRRGGLTALSLASLGCGYPLGFLRHGRRDDDPALEWLRAVFVSCFNQSIKAALPVLGKTALTRLSLSGSVF